MEGFRYSMLTSFPALKGSVHRSHREGLHQVGSGSEDHPKGDNRSMPLDPVKVGRVLVSLPQSHFPWAGEGGVVSFTEDNSK